MSEQQYQINGGTVKAGDNVWVEVEGSIVPGTFNGKSVYHGALLVLTGTLECNLYEWSIYAKERDALAAQAERLQCAIRVEKSSLEILESRLSAARARLAEVDIKPLPTPSEAK